MEPGRNDDEMREGARTLFLRLLQKLTRPGAPPEGDRRPADSQLLPPGQRSGRGTESLAPYLDNYRNTRPGALE
ncbi:hypothetical protein [Ramlibacter sp.]|uniref:hypothetical protein n=1 Tax=Ramlibacter sp. TaxID=1917967 RepID=UPI002D8064CB|nr:hypothetical protein [Ramlibacter sp.]